MLKLTEVFKFSNSVFNEHGRGFLSQSSVILIAYTSRYCNYHLINFVNILLKFSIRYVKINGLNKTLR